MSRFLFTHEIINKVKSGEYEKVRKTPNDIVFCRICEEKITNFNMLKILSSPPVKNVYVCESCGIKIKMF